MVRKVLGKINDIVGGENSSKLHFSMYLTVLLFRVANMMWLCFVHVIICRYIACFQIIAFSTCVCSKFTHPLGCTYKIYCTLTSCKPIVFSFNYVYHKLSHSLTITICSDCSIIQDMSWVKRSASGGHFYVVRQLEVSKNMARGEKNFSSTLSELTTGEQFTMYDERSESERTQKVNKGGWVISENWEQFTCLCTRQLSNIQINHRYLLIR